MFNSQIVRATTARSSRTRPTGWPAVSGAARPRQVGVAGGREATRVQPDGERGQDASQNMESVVNQVWGGEVNQEWGGEVSQERGGDDKSI